MINKGTLKNGNMLYWIGECEVKVTPEGYVCYVNNNHCFKRGSHEKIISTLGINLPDITAKEYFMMKR